MTDKRIGTVISLLAFCLLCLGSAVAGDKVKGKGVITARSGDTLTVETSDTTMTVTVTSDTKIEHPIGLGARKKQVGPEVLIAGLKLSFEGQGTDLDKVTAEKITFDKDDLTLARVIQAGLNPIAQQQAINSQNIAANQKNINSNQQAIAANSSLIETAAEAIADNNAMIAANQASIDLVAQATAQRFSELGQYALKDQTTVYFAVGDYTIAADFRDPLAALAKEALANGANAYLIQVSGYADSSGALADNQVLSRHRAEAVVAYLLQNCGIPVGRIVAPGAMSEAHPAASNETKSGRAENRRAEIKLLINKGIAGGS
jgi:OmpA-OmpF porin, OOP family